MGSHLHSLAVNKFHGHTVHQNIQHINFQLMHTTLKNVVIKTFLTGKMFQHVSVYKENIIREPQSVLS